MWYPTLSIDDLEKKKTKLYRFLTLDKFEKLMTGHKLFFARARILSDKFEGGFQIKEFANEFIKYGSDTFVSCWTRNDPRIESSLFMWRPNDKNENHVAIEVSIDKFLSDDYSSCFLQDEDYENFEPYIGKIDYLSQENEDYPKNYEPSILIPFFLKRRNFKDEDEIRILIQDMDRRGFFPFNIGRESKGINISIDLKKIDKFYISPTANDAISESVNDLIMKAGLNKTGEKVSVLTADYKKISKKLEYISKYNRKKPYLGEKPSSFKFKQKEYRFSKFFPDASGNVKVEDNVVITIQATQCYQKNNFLCHRISKVTHSPFNLNEPR